MDSIGRILRFTCFGESHGPAVGGVLEGLPARMPVDMEGLQRFMDRRRPGSNPLVTARNETDRVRFLSGLSPEGLTLGSPIAFMIENSDARPEAYEHLRHVYRPNHADYTYQAKYGIRDHRGGGRASARITASWTAAGALASQWLQTRGVTLCAAIESVGGDENIAEGVERARAAGDSIGGIVTCCIDNVPAGLGEPVFGKLQASLAHAMLSINGVHGFEYGDGFAMGRALGSEMIDKFIATEDKICTRTNHSGGIQGGISNGMPITLRVAFKPTPTLPRAVETVDDQGRPTSLLSGGRHDPCIALRGAVVVEAMAALVIADALLMYSR